MSVALPPGRVVYGDEGSDERPALWVSDDAEAAALWPSLRREHSASGLWPLLLNSYWNDDRRPWDDGELWPARMSSPDDHDPATVLDRWWTSYTSIDDDDMLSAADRTAITAPYGQRWPGLAPPIQPNIDPDGHADECARRLRERSPRLRLGLVPAGRSSDALAAAGWQGAVNYANDTAPLSAVLRSWEDRFGVRVIGAGFAEVHLSVAAPPSDRETALRVAAEHFAFCPDNIWQGQRPFTLTACAERLVNAPTWAFWWD